MVELCPTSRPVAWVKGYDKGILDFRILRTRMRLRTALAQEALCTAKHFKVAVSSMRGKSACTPCLHPRFVHTRCLFPVACRISTAFRHRSDGFGRVAGWST